MNPKQQRFVEEYLVDLNATQAAIRAGYSAKTAGQQAFDLLKKPEIQSAISTARKALSERTNVTAERIVAELAKIGFSDLRQLFDGGRLRSIEDLPDDVAAAVSAIEVVTKPGFDEDGNRTVEHVHKVRLWDKRAALVDLGKHLGMFVDRVEHNLGPSVLEVIYEDAKPKAEPD